jgi:hypothetical protein
MLILAAEDTQRHSLQNRHTCHAIVEKADLEWVRGLRPEPR